MKVTAILKGRIDANNQIPIQIRVNIGERRRFHPTDMRVTKAQFSKGRVKDHPKAASYNEEIKRLIVLHQAANIDGMKERKKKVDFYEYLQTCIDEWETYKTAGTMKVYRGLAKRMKEFRPTLYLHEIDLKFLNEWKKLRYKQVDGNTVWSNFTRLKAVINKAEKDKHITDNPFDDFEMPEYVDPEKIYLTKEDLYKIEAFLEESPEYGHCGYWFLIACHTGLRVSDIVAFTPKKHIVADRIILTTQKTADIVSLPLSDKLKGYFEKLEYKPLKYAEQTYREKIKIVVAAAKIKKEISTHTARHTAAVLMANAGISQEVVAKILGQKDLRSTAVYFKIINKKIDDDYGKFMDSL